MFAALARRVFGSANDRVVKGLDKTVAAVNSLEPEVKALSDDDLRGRTIWLRDRLDKGETLDDILPDAFATVREAARRTLGQRHFDVQIKGGVVQHQGRISEMKTGEGKTLVATLAVYLNAIEGKGVHVVTVNDYLAKRDAGWMGQVYEFLGLTVGSIVHGMNDVERRAAYACDVTYGTNNEFGFDYLRDNMKHRVEDMTQRPFNFAIVDEVDSILIDEARTPLIISGPTEDNSDLYYKVDKLIPHLVDADFEKDEKSRHVTLTDAGNEHIEQLLRGVALMKAGTLYDAANISLVHHVNQALRAHKLFTRDVDYIVKDDKVVIIDEFTGRMMEGRRYSEGLHQALEAKENVTIQNENQTLASITFQNYFRMYPKLAGMTGTAMTEAPEFSDIYGLDVVEIPTNVPVSRKDYDDEVYRTAAEKFKAISELVEECRARNQPVLVGTVSIEKSELLSEHLKKKKIPHAVLNARYHEQEAYIIADAGVPGAVTIATNMAGRGTDIQLGGNVKMRIERELKDMPAGPERDARIAAITAEVEARNFEIRKNLLKFDNVMNDQRKVIYEQRKEMMMATDLKEEVMSMRHEVINDLINRYVPEKAFAEQWDVKALHEETLRIFALDLPFAEWAKEEGIADEPMRERLVEAVDRRMAEKAANTGPDLMRAIEKSLILQVLDQNWKEHLLHMDHLRHAIGLRAYGQRDPLNEYKREGFEMFEAMLDRLREQATSMLSHIEIRAEAPQQAAPAAPAPVIENGIDKNNPATWANLNRNADCPCGSGKKYKHCHGKYA